MRNNCLDHTRNTQTTPFQVKLSCADWSVHSPIVCCLNLFNQISHSPLSTTAVTCRIELTILLKKIILYCKLTGLFACHFTVKTKIVENGICYAACLEPNTMYTYCWFFYTKSIPANWNRHCACVHHTRYVCDFNWKHIFTFSGCAEAGYCGQQFCFVFTSWNLNIKLLIKFG